jgi:hypothetical protein
MPGLRLPLDRELKLRNSRKRAFDQAMFCTRRRFIALGAAAVLPARAEGVALPSWRLAPEGWGEASVADVKSVLGSAMQQLWQYFPGRKLESMVVMRGREGPIVHYKRNDLKELVVQLDTGGLYWCQYAYQFAHEFCHILCGFDDDWKGNLWFEESLCETASLFVLRRMAEVWAKEPPFETWRGYAPRFTEYADDVMSRRTVVSESRLPDYYRKHRARLAANPVDRELNGAISRLLLRVMEAKPEAWESVTWLNSAPSKPGETFEAYLTKWRRAAPARCHAFIDDMARRFGVKL